jgi:hypothetical protein
MLVSFREQERDMSLAAQTHSTADWRWLYSPTFDLFFILGFFTLGLMTVTVVLVNPALFIPILLVDLWVLGYHHVISTYTRLCFDKESFERSRFMLFGLFPIVAIATVALAWIAGVWAVFSLYFYWQWWHYTRQSWGVSRAYRAKEREAMYEDGWLEQAIFYSIPVLGVIYRSWQGPQKFLGMELFVVAIPDWLMIASSLAATALLGYWILRRVQACGSGRLTHTHTLYMATHFLVFGFAYLLIADVTFGWLLVNMWHNGQYILFVWMFNASRFKSGVTPKAKLLSYLSQPNRLWLYMIVCLAITAVIYVGLLGTMEKMLAMGMIGSIMIYQTVNFHHYVVDSFIWKVRKGPLKETLDL